MDLLGERRSITKVIIGKNYVSAQVYERLLFPLPLVVEDGRTPFAGDSSVGVTERDLDLGLRCVAVVEEAGSVGRDAVGDSGGFSPESLTSGSVCLRLPSLGTTAVNLRFLKGGEGVETAADLDSAMPTLREILSSSTWSPPEDAASEKCPT